MKKLAFVYSGVFLILCSSFFFVGKAYLEWSEYSALAQRANNVLIVYEDLGMQISNAAALNPDLISAKNLGHYPNVFSVNKSAILKNLDKLTLLVRDSINIKIATQLDRSMRSEIDWIIQSNVPDSIVHQKAKQHITNFDKINKLLHQGVERTRFILDYRQQHLNKSFDLLVIMTLVFFIVTVSLLIDAILGLFDQRAKARKKEGQLIEKDAQFRYILDNMLEGVQIHDFNWRYTYVNDSIAKSLNCRKEDLIGCTLMEKYPGIEQSDLFKEFEICMKERTSKQMESKFIHADGSWSDFEISIQPVPEGIFILSINKTEQKKAKHKLEKSIKELSDLKFALDESSIVAVTDQNGIITHVNDNFCKISKYSPDELIGQDHRIINSGFHSKEYIQTLWETLANGNIWKGELKNHAKDGTHYWVDAAIIPFLDKNGKPYQYYAIHSDITQRKNTEEKIKAGELKYSNVVETIHESLIIEDLEGKLVYANNEFVKTFGFSTEEFRDLTLKDYTSEESYPEILERHNKRLSGLPVEDEFIYKAKRKDGKEIWIEARVSLLIEDGKIVGTQSLERDITQRVNAEEKAKKTSRMFAFLSAVNQSIVHVTNEQKLLEDLCDIATGIGQFKLAYVGLLDAQNLLHIASLSGDKKGAEKIIKINGLQVDDPAYQEVPTIKVLKTGEYSHHNDMQNDPAFAAWKNDFIQHGIHASISLPLFKFGNAMGVVGLHAGSRGFFDLEEIALLIKAAENISFALENIQNTKIHKETAILLEKNEKRFRGMIEKSADFTTLTDKSGRLTYGSPSVLTFFGYSQEEFMNKEAMSFFHPGDVPDLINNRNVILDKPGAFYKFQYRIGHKNGSWVWCEGTVTNFLQEPSIQAMVTNFRDISENKKNAMEKENLIKQLTLNNQDLRQFAYITSHNLRGPIANLLGLTNLLGTLKVKDPTLIKILTGIKTATVMFDDTIKDLATILTLRDNPTIQLETISFEIIFEKVKDFCGSSLTGCQAEIVSDFNASPTVSFNKAYLESIFMNLLTNAIKYKDDSRRLKITVKTYEEDDATVLTFSDNGIGFDSEMQKEKVFKLYQRFHLHKEGKGLGLFLIKSQLEALGGTIEVESSANKGTTFTIKFKPHLNLNS